MYHTGDKYRTYSSPEKLGRVLDLFPRLTVIAAHLGGYRIWEQSMEYLVGRDVYFDTSSSLFMLDKKEAVRIIRKHGIHKVLFGSDYPMWHPDEELKRFMELDLTREEQEMILWKNACTLLRIPME
jgi:predicted TIM-barrel fold metal-dependent hydrolase